MVIDQATTQQTINQQKPFLLFQNKNSTIHNNKPTQSLPPFNSTNKSQSQQYPQLKIKVQAKLPLPQSSK
jgi:hypothetical protein